MDQFYYSVNIDNTRTLCLSQMTDRLLSLCEQDVGDGAGYFLYERRTRGEIVNIEVIARVMSDEGALRLRQAFNMS
jgi:hypothetical protein